MCKAFSFGKTGLILTQVLLKSNPCIRKTQRFFHVVLLVSDLDNPGHSALTPHEFPESQEAGETPVPTLRGPPCTHVHPAAAQRSRDLPGGPCPPHRGRDALSAAAVAEAAVPRLRRGGHRRPPGASGSRPPPHQAALTGRHGEKRNSQNSQFLPSNPSAQVHV